jgi:hypothetical protein
LRETMNNMSEKKPVIIAVLRTRCGCSREMEIPSPMPILRIPLKLKNEFIRLDRNPSHFLVEERTFRMIAYVYTNELNSEKPSEQIHVLYEEM